METTLLSSTNEWLYNMDKGLFTGVLFLDLKKAFDTVDHGIKGIPLNGLNLILKSEYQARDALRAYVYLHACGSTLHFVRYHMKYSSCSHCCAK